MAPTLTPDRPTFRSLVADIAAKAKARLPQAVNGRVESAAKLVLLHDVTPQDDGTILVGSSTDPCKQYRLVGDTCECLDWQHGKAPDGWCKHRISAGIAKRVQELMPQAPTMETAMAPAPLPEARASLNFKAMVGGYEIMVTLRDETEEALLGRLQALLKRQDIRPLPKSAPRSAGWSKGRQGGSHGR